MTDTEMRLRKDAELNRQRLLESARVLFAERGLGVTLNDIAHHAGVGVGTAYRRFSSKDELINATLDRQIDDIARVADEALADPDPWHGLVHYMEGVMTLQANDRGLAHVLTGEWSQPEQHDKSLRLAPKVEAIVARAHQAGVMRADATATDLIFIQLGLNAILDRTRDASPDYYRRHLAIALDGLHEPNPRHSTMSTAPLTTRQTHELLGRRRGSRR